MDLNLLDSIKTILVLTFTIAIVVIIHELGHFIYHRNLLGAGVGDTRAYRAEGTRFPNAAIRPVHERQANSFAANLLMPHASINALRVQGVTTVPDLAERLQVSQDAMRIRLGLPRT